MPAKKIKRKNNQLHKRRNNKSFRRPESNVVRSSSFLFWFRVLTVAYWIFLTLLLWLPDPRVILFGWEPAEGPRGYAHVITFSLLGLLVELGRRKGSILFWAGILIGYTFLTEIVQIMIPYRAFEWEDIFQDLVGAFLGLGAGCVLHRIRAALSQRALGFY